MQRRMDYDEPPPRILGKGQRIDDIHFAVEGASAPELRPSGVIEHDCGYCSPGQKRDLRCAILTYLYRRMDIVDSS